jgi:outer membrane protein assembly factor BamA
MQNRIVIRGLFALFFFAGTLAGADSAMQFSDSGCTYRIDCSSVKSTVVRAYLKQARRGNAGMALSHFLDSLGYFDQSWDSTKAGTITVAPAKRAMLDSVAIRTLTAVVLDSLPRWRLPRLYDSGEIAAMAQQILVRCGSIGFPFSDITIQLDTSRYGPLPDKPRLVKAVFFVNPGQSAVFDEPLFYGAIRTRSRQLGEDILFMPGRPFDIRAIRASEQRLRLRPYIAAVQAGAPVVLSPVASAKLLLADSADCSLRVAVPFTIQEKSGLGLDGALAYTNEAGPAGGRFSGLFNLSILNILGIGEMAGLEYRGEKDFQKVAISVSKTHFFSVPLTVGAGLGLEVKQKEYGFLNSEISALIDVKNVWQVGIAMTGHEVNTNTDSLQTKQRFFGMDLLLRSRPEPYRAGIVSREIKLRTGSGIADNETASFWRWRFDFSAGVHVPVFSKQGFAIRLVAQNITTARDDTLHTVEKFRTGGRASVRGYAEEQFPFATVAYTQLELLHYFGSTGALSVFADGGAGFVEQVSLQKTARTNMLGYGIAIRIPVKVGVASIAWARNIDDVRSLGRIHVRIQNTLSSEGVW